MKFSISKKATANEVKQAVAEEIKQARKEHPADAALLSALRDNLFRTIDTAGPDDIVEVSASIDVETKITKALPAE